MIDYQQVEIWVWRIVISVILIYIIAKQIESDNKK